MQYSKSVTVIGSGVSGLTSAFKLASAGFLVTVVSKEEPSQTTSAVAAAFWWPYDLEPVSRARPWATQSFHKFRELAQTIPESGVRMRHGTYRCRPGRKEPWFASLVGFRVATSRSRDIASYELETSIIDMPVYLEWLHAQCLKVGVVFKRREIRSIDEMDADAVVNCSGLGSRDLADDGDMNPVSGQVIVVRGTGIEEFVKDETEPGVATYIYPRTDTVILGGTTDASSRTEVDEMTTARIIERCAALDPRVHEGEVADVIVGLRPNRSSIRLEAEQRGRKRVIHNYGHGRAGVSLAWGCAYEVLDLLTL